MRGLRAPRLRLARLVAPMALALSAGCNLVFGLDPLAYEAPTRPSDASAEEAASDAGASPEASTGDAARID